MKTKFFNCASTGRTHRFAPTAYCLLVLLTATFCAAAQNGVTVENLSVGAGTVTFDVSWDKNAMPVTLWSDTVWVFVDYNDAGKMKRLPLAPGATLTTHTAPDVGRVIQYDDNNKGVWVVGNARSAESFSATVQLLTETASTGGSESRPLHGACAYASNYPPVGEYTLSNHVTFTGTPPYTIVLRNSAGSTVSASSSVGDFPILSEQYTRVASFTDKTGAPGIMKCIPMTGPIDFSAPAVAKEQLVSFSVTVSPSTPSVGVTYSWSAPDFSPTTGTGTSFSTTAPAASGSYPVTLTAHGADYCDLPWVKDVPVVDCHGGRLGSGAPCQGNDGGRLGING
jgi:hypothetical protein